MGSRPPPGGGPAQVNFFGAHVPTPQNPDGADSDSPAADLNSTDLYKHMEQHRIYGVNVGPAGTRDLQEASKRCIKPWHLRTDMAASTESLEGGSVIINIPFQQSVRVSSMLINQGSGENAPRRVRLYVNRPHGLDFDDVAEDEPLPPVASSSAAAGSSRGATTGPPNSGLPQADFLLRAQDATVTTVDDRVQEYPLARFAARFAHTQSIHVVLSDSPAEPCRTYYLSFRGVAPQELQDKTHLLSVHAEDAASSPMGRVRQAMGGDVGAAATSGSRGSAADGSGGQAR